MLLQQSVESVFMWVLPEYILSLSLSSLSPRSVARKETLGVHQKNWVCHIYCQINAQKKTKKQACLLGINMLV